MKKPETDCILDVDFPKPEFKIIQCDPYDTRWIANCEYLNLFDREVIFAYFGPFWWERNVWIPMVRSVCTRHFYLIHGKRRRTVRLQTDLDKVFQYHRGVVITYGDRYPIYHNLKHVKHFTKFVGWDSFIGDETLLRRSATVRWCDPEFTEIRKQLVQHLVSRYPSSAFIWPSEYVETICRPPKFRGNIKVRTGFSKFLVWNRAHATLLPSDSISLPAEWWYNLADFIQRRFELKVVISGHYWTLDHKKRFAGALCGQVPIKDAIRITIRALGLSDFVICPFGDESSIACMTPGTPIICFGPEKHRRTFEEFEKPVNTKTLYVSKWGYSPPLDEFLAYIMGFMEEAVRNPQSRQRLFAIQSEARGSVVTRRRKIEQEETSTGMDALPSMLDDLPMPVESLRDMVKFRDLKRRG